MKLTVLLVKKGTAITVPFGCMRVNFYNAVATPCSFISNVLWPDAASGVAVMVKSGPVVVTSHSVIVN